MFGEAKIDRRTLLTGAGVAALEPVTASAYTSSEGMANDVATALAQFRSSIISSTTMSSMPLSRSSWRASIRANARRSP